MVLVTVILVLLSTHSMPPSPHPLPHLTSFYQTKADATSPTCHIIGSVCFCVTVEWWGHQVMVALVQITEPWQWGRMRWDPGILTWSFPGLLQQKWLWAMAGSPPHRSACAFDVLPWEGTPVGALSSVLLCVMRSPIYLHDVIGDV
jgi:hypothetical protein